MDWFKKIMAAVGTLASGAGEVVDAAVPVFHGDRTKISVALGLAGPLLCKALGPVVPAVCPIIQSVTALAMTMAPLFALAGLVRKPS